MTTRYSARPGLLPLLGRHAVGKALIRTLYLGVRKTGLGRRAGEDRVHGGEQVRRAVGLLQQGGEAALAVVGEVVRAVGAADDHRGAAGQGAEAAQVGPAGG